MVQRHLLNHYLARTTGMLSGARRASLMLLVMLLTTSTAWAQDPASIGSISYNSSISAYEINSVNNLNDLAVYVNGTGTYSIGGDESTPHTCSGLSFKMTDPITYDGSENNYTPIGNDSQSFDGTFDGQGKAISGININNTSARYQAIFGSVQGTVKNLVVSNCSIVAYQQVGAIAGTIQGLGTIENCSVGNGVTLSGNSDIGGISGGNDGGTIKGCTCAATINGTKAGGCNAYYLGGIAGSASNAGGPTPYLTDNRFTGAIDGYLDDYIGAIVGWSDHASLTNNIYTSTGFGGIGAASSSTGADGVGASRPYSVTFDENGGTAVPDLEVALGTVISAPATTREGYTLTGWKNGSTDFDFSTPVTSNLELTAQWAIPYIDKNGNTAYCTNFTVLDNTMTTISAGWYVVNSDVTFSGNLSTNAGGDVHIILCDGATLTANYIVFGHSNHLYIYGQSHGTGTASISYIEASNSLQICGGIINVTGVITSPTGSVGIYGGTVTAAQISGKYNLTFTGGTITAGSLTADEGSIKLGGATVKANSYSAHNGVTITNGITYYDGTGASYPAGNLTSSQISAIRGKTLRTYDYRSGTCGKDDPATGDVDESQNVTWMLTGNTLTISKTGEGTGSMADYAEASGQPWTAMHSDIKAIVIEDDVTSIGNYAFYSTDLTSIEIPASVTSIGANAFSSCYDLGSVTFAEGSRLESIGDYAFLNCYNLTSITIPASVTSIGEDVFLSCDNLASMTVADGNTVYDSRNGCNAIIEKLTNKLIIGCKNSTIPTSVTSIGAWAFYFTRLTSIEIPASVTSIGEHAFQSCRNLATVTVYAPSCTLGVKAFLYCNNLANIYVFSDKVATYKAAENWSAYKDIITGITGGYCGTTDHERDVVWRYDNGILTISGTGQMMYYGSALGGDNKYHSTAPWSYLDSEIQKVIVEDGVTYIGSYAFAYCTALTSVSLPATVSQMGNYVCYSSNVTRIDIPATTAATIGIGGFDACPADLQIAVPSTLLGTYQTAGNWSAYTDKLVGVLNETTGFGNTFATGNYKYTRTFKCGIASTVCLPFSVTAAQAASVGKFYTFDGIDKTGEKWEVIMKETNTVSTDLSANTPYLFMPYIFDGMSQGDAVEFTFSGTVSTAGNGDYYSWTEPGTSSYWTFQGVYYNYKWEEGHADLGSVYGFAARDYTNVNPGDFVKAAAGASIAPFRAFLQYTPAPSNAPRRGVADNEVLPSRMSVRLVNADGTVTAIGTMDTKTGEVSFDNDAWYTLDGRRLNSTPGTRGIYIKNGRKIILK